MTHFYITISGKRFRVKKSFYISLKTSIASEVFGVKKGVSPGKSSTVILDKFYTKEWVAKRCVSTVLATIAVQERDLIVEPSAGDGAFLEPLKSVGCKKIFLDVMPENSAIKKIDFLSWKPPRVTGKIHIIGNPPFGRQSSLCHQFIKHSSLFADSISFILPISFKKRSNLGKIPTKFHLAEEILLPLDSFSVGNFTHKIPAVFQV